MKQTPHTKKIADKSSAKPDGLPEGLEMTPEELHALLMHVLDLYIDEYGHTHSQSWCTLYNYPFYQQIA